MLRLSANLGFLWPDRPLPARIAAAAAAGFKAVELHWPYDMPASELRTMLSSHGLVLLGINTPVGARDGDFGLAALPGRQAEFAEVFEQSLAYAESAGAAAIHVMAGVPGGEDPAKARGVLEANLARIAPLAEAKGLTLLLEPMNPRDRPGYFYHRVEDAAAIIRSVGSPVLRLMFDCYHVQVAQGDVVRRFAAHQAIIGHVQIAAAPSRAEPDEGELDYGFVLREIDRLGWTGWVGAEYKPRAGTDEGLGWREALGVS